MSIARVSRPARFSPTSEPPPASSPCEASRLATRRRQGPVARPLLILASICLAFGTLPAIAADRIESDWLYQNRLRGARHPADAPPSTADDAAGAVDGVKNGGYGFHTGQNDNPSWWQVDLGMRRRLDRVVIFNRCDFPAAPLPQPTAQLELLLSADGKVWGPAYKHNRANFYGFTDKKPLVIALGGIDARFIRLQVPPHNYLHFDEVEVYGTDTPEKNIALHCPADQSSLSQWSTRKSPTQPGNEPPYRIAEIIDRGRNLATDLRTTLRTSSSSSALSRQTTETIDDALRTLDEIEKSLPTESAASALTGGISNREQTLYLRARSTVRKLALANPALDFDRVLFVKRALGSFSHMSDQYYSWFSRPGGGVFILDGIKTDNPRLRSLTESFPPGSYLSPDLSCDARKILFSYCRHYPGRSNLPNKLDKDAQPEDSFYHVFEINVNGTGLRQITHGRYDDLFPRYLPSGEIVFLSTRRGQFFQCGKASATATTERTLPDSFVRCGGDPGRPVSVYTLHVMNPAGQDMRAISPFENFEWDPSVSNDGRILYSRWDYVDRDNMHYMKLWATNPDGTSPQAVWGNYTRNPQCAFEARGVPGSRKIVFTAAAHHAITGGSLVLLDPALGEADGHAAIKRLTPEVLFPEAEGWSEAYYANPYPLSETYYLTAWGAPMQPGCPPQAQWGQTGPTNALGIYLLDAFGNLELLHRDPDLCSMYPIPVRPRPVPPAVATGIDWDGKQIGAMLVQDVYAGLTGVDRGAIKRLRIVGMPAKVQPTMNTPKLGVTADDPGKCVLGTVPVEPDGSAHFSVPSGVALFIQALDDQDR
ncbi:MAG: discoidin domain-containing protein, partial [Tepidisphaeraceae bacterium]